jgi:hypothetical protein
MWITINKERLSSLPLDEDILSSFLTIVKDEQGEASTEDTMEEALSQPCV